MDFYASPITIEVDGVDIRLRIVTTDQTEAAQDATDADADAAVPNTVDLAQSFLETEPQAEKRRLEKALEAENHDLAASFTSNDHGFDEEPAFGTGQPLSLPFFLADFLQGIMDRMQISIHAVSFQLEVDVATEQSAAKSEPVSFQVTLDSVSIEGVTTPTAPQEHADTDIHKDGKRHISLANVRAYITSEASVLPLMSQSPSVASPASASSPALSRNPVSRQGSSLSDLVPPDDLVSSFQPTIPRQSPGSPDSGRDSPEYPDTEGGLGISQRELDAPFGTSLPSTPKASVFQGFGHESISEQTPVTDSVDLSSTTSPSNSTLLKELPYRSLGSSFAQSSPDSSRSDVAKSTILGSDTIEEDLSESHLYTHEEAESMYMSAFSQHDTPMSQQLPGAQLSHPNAPSSSAGMEGSVLGQSIYQSTSAMPGGWDTGEAVPNPRGRNVPVVASNTVEAPHHSAENLQRTDSHDTTENDAAEADTRDGTATPRGPTRVVKEIMSFDKLSVYVPSSRKRDAIQPQNVPAASLQGQDLGASIYPQAPGAFSVHNNLPGASQGLGASAILGQSDVGPEIDISISPIEFNFDASLVFILASAVSKLMAALQLNRDTPATSKQQENAASNDMTAAPVKLVIDEIAFNFLSRLPGQVAPRNRKADRTASLFDRDVLLNATIGQLSLNRGPLDPAENKDVPKTGATLTRVDLQKFRFGYSNGDIVSFGSERSMSASVKDTFLCNGHDIGIKIIETKTDTRTDIETLPLVLQIELQRLDETFSWFGGLSSFLNMSTSMAATASPPAKPSPPAPKPRGVRFDTLIHPSDKSASSANKISVRIGGGYVKLLGKECSITAETKAIKSVSRDEGVGLFCSLVRLSGPYLRHSTADPAITIDFTSIGANFRTAPETTDLEKLLNLVIPTKLKYDHTTDEIMVDTLLSQRRKGSLLRLNVNKIGIKVSNMSQLVVLPNLGEELGKLSTVAKYLPEDDRPGLLTLGKVQRITVNVEFDNTLGVLDAEIADLEVGHITVPSLIAVLAEDVTLTRNKSEELIQSSPFRSTQDISSKRPVFMVRMIGDEIEPIIKIKLHDLLVEYRVPTIMDLMGLADDATPQDFEEGLAASVADLGERTQAALTRQSSTLSQSKQSKPMKLDIAFRDCMLGLNPLNLESKMIIVLAESQLDVTLPEDRQMETTLNITEASVLLVDDFAEAMRQDVAPIVPTRQSLARSPHVVELCDRGFVDICYITSAVAVIRVSPGPDGEQQVAVDLQDDLFVLGTCADSTQTLITLANALKPPTPPSKENKYRTNVVPVQDLLASISAEAFGRSEGEYDFDQDFAGAQEMAGSESDAGLGSGNLLRVDSHFYAEEAGEELFDATKSTTSSQAPSMEDTAEGVLLTGFNASFGQDSVDSDDLVIHDNFYTHNPTTDGTAKVWNSNKNTYDSAPSKLVRHSPVRARVRGAHVVWNLFDGYDWGRTRDVIGKAVQDVQTRAIERQARLTGQHFEDEQEQEHETVGDFLFNSIYIDVPANRDPHELSRAINAEINDNATETESVATTAFTGATNRTARRSQPRSKRLKLNRSRHHKIAFELHGLEMDLTVFPPDSGETVSSIDVRVQNLDILDHVPTSTWKKFATYDQDQGEREMGTNMVHLELLTVKPIPQLGASETVLRATVLPLRLHVDQDALDFITRFFEFKDDKVPVHASPSDIPFVQRAEINSIPVKLDFKPKRVDYGGLRSGHTTEFMNFIVLEESRMVLRHVIIYGISGFDRLGKTLNDIWMPDVRNNQLPGVIAGLAPVRSLVNIGSGFKDLVEIPIREYQKDGRVFRSISKGATAFARNTGTELVKLGAKIAVGTQYALQGAEDMLTDKPQGGGDTGWDDEDLDEEEKKQISLYADQPTGVMQGIRGGYRSLVRDMNVARDAIIAVPGEVMESQSATGAAKAVLRHAPTIMFRPTIGVSRAVGKAFMGATNTIDPHNRRRIDEVCILHEVKITWHD